MIIDRYVLITILLLVFWVFFFYSSIILPCSFFFFFFPSSSSFSFFPCGLMGFLIHEAESGTLGSISQTGSK